MGLTDLMTNILGRHVDSRCQRWAQNTQQAQKPARRATNPKQQELVVFYLIVGVCGMGPITIGAGLVPLEARIAAEQYRSRPVTNVCTTPTLMLRRKLKHGRPTP